MAPFSTKRYSIVMLRFVWVWYVTGSFCVLLAARAAEPNDTNLSA
jgi:hypothetical protein